MNIFATIKDETAQLLHNIALIDAGDQVTYEQLLHASELVSSELSRQGVNRFCRVGLLCEDSIDYVCTSLAILSIGGVIVPISPDQSKEEIQSVIAKIDLDFLIAEKRLQYDGVPLPQELFRSRSFTILQRGATRPAEGYYALNPAFIRFSSGTTGASKGVVLSHEAIIARTDAADKGLQITSSDRVLWVLSMSFHFVVTILLFLRRGATIILCGKNLPHAIIDGILNQNGTFIYASPFHYSLLAGSTDIPADAFRNIRMAISTAMKLPESTAEEFALKFGMELTEAYGIIEVGLPFVRISDPTKKGSVGKALPDYRIRLRNQDENGVGDILIKGQGMLDAYYSPWQGKTDILTDGWFSTGDLGRIDEDGFLFIVGRMKDVINFVGMKIFAQEVEAVINRHPS
ncbi:MAG TPA: class I adenylate-forming enzyme family protein, partial [Geobacteraceae bacterium]|nr:class I adenylate-forming enzyme family protein [Geobacteraceae bacterium]